MSINITRAVLISERVSYSRDQVIDLLMEDEDYFSEEEMARGLGVTPSEGRRLWSERSDAELAEFLAERLNEDGDLHARNIVVQALGERGTDAQRWTAWSAEPTIIPISPLPVAGLMTRYTTRLTIINDKSVQPDGSIKWFDTLAVFNEDGEQVGSVSVESSEDEQPYRQALADAGWVIAGRTNDGADWRVRRA
jgi:hypothetical protein